MKTRYEWKVLSEDGLLKDVKTTRGYGSTLDGGDTHEEAVSELISARKNQLIAHGSYVLLTVCTVAWDE